MENLAQHTEDDVLEAEEDVAVAVEVLSAASQAVVELLAVMAVPTMSWVPDSGVME